MITTQCRVDQENSEFWNELCGTGEARKLGITDSSKASLARFDTWYLNYYPYLLPIVQPARMQGKKVLEIGLGYGTLGQQLAQAGAIYTGMDIAQNPVDHMSYRLRLHDLPGRALRGSALSMPFPDESFDFLVSIGCMHHTGDVQRCFDETYRVLKPGGVAVLMVYNKYSFMRWRLAPWTTFVGAIRSFFAPAITGSIASPLRRADFDSNMEGKAAPETAVLSVGELKRMLRTFAEVSCSKRNANPLVAKGITFLPRPWLLPALGRVLGLDIYVEARKSARAVARAAA